jgi:hypothetical protein
MASDYMTRAESVLKQMRTAQENLIALGNILEQDNSEYKEGEGPLEAYEAFMGAIEKQATAIMFMRDGIKELHS